MSNDVAVEYRTTAELEAELDEIRGAPKTVGTLELIVRRPAVDEREILEEGTLDLAVGLVGDTWKSRGSSSTSDGSSNPDCQITVANVRAVSAVAGAKDRWALAGDQLYIDMDVSEGNLPPGSRLAIGDAVIEMSAKPHTGCSKFAARFGKEALRFVNTGAGKDLSLRGRNARVVVPGTIRLSDKVRRI